MAFPPLYGFALFCCLFPVAIFTPCVLECLYALFASTAAAQIIENGLTYNRVPWKERVIKGIGGKVSETVIFKAAVFLSVLSNKPIVK